MYLLDRQYHFFFRFYPFGNAFYLCISLFVILPENVELGITDIQMKNLF